jgi:hypothetical protein
MVKTLISCLVVAMLGAPLSGCIVRTRDDHHHRHRHRNVRQPSCHQSQYWDGHQCRHKGRGHGARKHDGRR